MREKIVFFGNGPYVDSILEILRREFDVVKVVSSKETLDSQLAKKLKSTGAKVGVLASFGKIIPDSFLNLFEYGIINIHPSLLPKFRGPTPIQTAILDGEKMTGVSIIKLDKEVDHGDLIGMIDSEIGPNDTSESLYKKLFTLGADFLAVVLPKYLSGKLKPFAQNHSNATYTDRLTRESGLIDVSKPPKKEELERMIRAYYPWPGVWFNANINNKQKIIKLLPGNKIQVEGKNAMLVKDFTNGYPEGKEIVNKLNLDEKT